MKLVTFNINGIRARLPRLLEYLDREQPDVACLQELKCADDSLPIAEIEGAGYQAVWHGQKGFNGVAILSRGAAPALRQVGLPDDPDDTHSRYIEAAVGGIIVGCLYLPNGNPRPGPKFDYKMRWIGRFEALAAELVGLDASVVIAGDYNIIPTDIDVYKPERWLDDALFAPEAKAAYARIVEQGWTDALRKLYPDEKVYTFWKYWRGAFERDAGLRIDHLLLSPTLARRLVAAGVDREPRGWDKTSDHAPAWIELRD
jgi:exodeoxyribonuclease-3